MSQAIPDALVVRFVYPPLHWNVHCVLSAVFTSTASLGAVPHEVGVLIPALGHLFPGGHSWQVLNPVDGEYDPGEQSTHEDICPTPYLPAGQDVHARVYPPALYRPLAHAWHVHGTRLAVPSHPPKK